MFNAGAVMFHGVTDDTLARAAALLGDARRRRPAAGRALATYERVGAQWWRDRLASWPPAGLADGVLVDAPPGAPAPAPGGLWLVGPEATAAPLRALRGFGYLRELVRRPGQPSPRWIWSARAPASP